MCEIRLQITEEDTEQELDTHLEEALEPNCRVFIHNDDVTPFDFVIIILQRIFQLKSLEAEHVAFVAHTSGLAYVATLPCPEAHKRVGKAHFAASLEGYPLMFTVEPED
ncbi:MAG: ATP-dependent Clp protease adaptor ClpS [Chloroflexi bacterium]|jgi:ATP-dependent Clp protease adaptor protein ClpS|nr:ATP-dependent Clp protease adaptor ClpS [Chloroflexota bacterium]